MKTLCMFTFISILSFSQLLVSIQAKKDVLKVTSILGPPYLMQTSSNSTKLEGFIIDLLNRICEDIKVDYELKLVKDGRYGALLPNGSWSGMIGEVVRGEADLAAAALSATLTRRRVVEFTPAIQNYGHVVVLKKPQQWWASPTFQDRITYLYTPFSYSVWLMSLISYLITSTVLFAISYLNPYEWKRMAKDGEASVREGETFNCVNSFWFIVSSWALQGFGARTPRSLGGRTVVLFWWIFVVLFVSTYIAGLSNFLKISAIPKVSRSISPIHNLKDLSEQTEIQYAMLSSGATQSYFESSPLEYMKRIYQSVRSNPDLNIKTTYQGIKRVRESNGLAFGFIMESEMAKYYAMRKPCDLYYAGDITYTGNYAFAYGLNSKYGFHFDSAILGLRESGFLQAIEEKWFTGSCEKLYVDSSTKAGELSRDGFVFIGLGNFSGAFFLLLVGVVVGCLFTGVEIIVFKKVETGTNNRRGEIDEEGRKVTTLPLTGATEKS